MAKPGSPAEEKNRAVRQTPRASVLVGVIIIIWQNSWWLAAIVHPMPAVLGEDDFGAHDGAAVFESDLEPIIN